MNLLYEMLEIVVIIAQGGKPNANYTVVSKAPIFEVLCLVLCQLFVEMIMK